MAVAALLDHHHILQTMEVKPGDFLVTRNTDAVGNESPGHWNHCAVVIDGNWVVESTYVFGCTIAVPIWTFFNRYPEVLVLRAINVDEQATLRMIEKAKSLIGRPYDKYGSVGVTWIHRRGDNCVSLVRRSYLAGFSIDPGWVKPDSLVRSFQTLQAVSHKKDYENHKELPSTEKYKGAIKIVPDAPAEAMAN